jgi:SAM-dependent methyltransferase
MRQQLRFGNSAHYWESHYGRGGDSGGGSSGDLAAAKARFLNSLVRGEGVRSVVEFGCGDGRQLTLAQYPRYVGLDVSRTAIGLCKDRFSGDPTKSFFLYDGDCFVDNAGVFAGDLAISLDVVYHLVEDRVFTAYMRHLFGSGRRYVVVYSTNSAAGWTAPHVRHRNFTRWVSEMLPLWRLAQVTAGPRSQSGGADFYVYQRRERGNP